MADKVALGELLSKKLSELEVSNSIYSEEEVKKQKEELKNELKPCKDVYKNNNKPASERIQLLQDLITKYVNHRLLQVDGETEAEMEYKKVSKMANEAQKERDEMNFEANKTEKEKENMKHRCVEYQNQIKKIKDVLAGLAPEEERQRKEIKDNFDKAIKDFKEKMRGEVSEEELKKKNDELKAEGERIMEENKQHTAEIEKRIQEKQKNSEAAQERFKAMIQGKFEEAMSASAKEKKTFIELTQKEQQVTAEISMYENNFESINDSIRKSGSVFGQFKKELKKVLCSFILQKSEMLNSVEHQKTELMRIKDKLDAEQVELRQELEKLNEEKEATKEECQNLQKELKNKAS